MRPRIGSSVKRLLDRQFEQGFADHLPLPDLEDPELPALARVFGDRLAILAADGNPELVGARSLRCDTLPGTRARTTGAGVVITPLAMSAASRAAGAIMPAALAVSMGAAIALLVIRRLLVAAAAASLRERTLRAPSS